MSASRSPCRGACLCFLLLFASACRTPIEGARTSPNSSGSGPSEALIRFLDAVEAGDFDAAYRMMAGSWRARYTPQRLQQDFEGEPLARERVARARAALASPPIVRDNSAEFSLGDGKAVRLVREEGIFRVAALE